MKQNFVLRAIEKSWVDFDDSTRGTDAELQRSPRIIQVRWYSSTATILLRLRGMC